MDSNALYASVIYLLGFRLAVISLGALSIYLGYRLFLAGFSGTTGSGEGSLGAKFGDTELTLKNAAPGTFFAAFGVIITVSILTASPPSFTQHQELAADGTSRALVTEMRGETEPSGTPAERLWQHYDKALAAAQEAAKTEPNNATYQEIIGLLRAVEGGEAALDEAVAALEEAARLDPNRPELAGLAAFYRQYP